MVRRRDALLFFRACLGVAGVAPSESLTNRKIGRRFEFCLLLIALWLPVEWYARQHALFPAFVIEISRWIIWLGFVLETSVLTYKVKAKKYYLLTNWLNLLIIFLMFPLFLPHLPFLVVVRVLRVLLMFRFLVPWLEFSRSFLAKNHLGTTLLVALILTTTSGLVITSIDPGIHGPGNGIWWAWQTITSVGYGDVVPVSLWGRVLAVFVMIFSIGLISVLTANFSAFFIRQEDEAKQKVLAKQINQRLRRVESQLDRLEALCEKQCLLIQTSTQQQTKKRTEKD